MTLNLNEVVDYANERLASGDEPPWSYYRLWQLREAAQCLIENRLTPLGPEDLQQLVSQPETSPQRQGTVVRLHTVQSPEPTQEAARKK